MLLSKINYFLMQVQYIRLENAWRHVFINNFFNLLRLMINCKQYVTVGILHYFTRSSVSVKYKTGFNITN